jgi:hypothetical protein
MFEKLIKASGTLSPSVTKLLHKAGLPVGKVSDGDDGSEEQCFPTPSFILLEEKELLRLTNPDNIRVEASYRGPSERERVLFDGKVNRMTRLLS